MLLAVVTSEFSRKLDLQSTVNITPFSTCNYLFKMYSPSDMFWSVVDEGVADWVGGVSVDVELLLELAERLSL